MSDDAIGRRDGAISVDEADADAAPVGSRPEADGDGGPGGPLFWLSMLFGAVVIVVTVVRYRAGAGSPGQQSTATFLLGAGIAHDALWAPVAVVVGLLTFHLVPAWCRVPVRLGLAFTALVVLLSWPEVRGYGRTPSNPSILPLDYGRNLVVVLALIWAAVAVAVTVRGMRGRSPS